jgi:DUF971 family protein
MNPVKIKVENQQFLYILWDDNSETRIDLQVLRDACPCAECQSGEKKKVETKSGSLPFKPLSLGKSYEIADIKVVGNYALNIFWKDGHHTGIYEYGYLRKLG